MAAKEKGEVGQGEDLGKARGGGERLHSNGANMNPAGQCSSTNRAHALV